MLAIRMQRTGRKGHAQFRIVVQDSRLAPTSGKVIASLGSYNPHTKQSLLVKEKTEFYLSHGAQPSDRVARLLKKEGIKLPKWVNLQEEKKRTVRNPEKLRKNQGEVAQPKETDKSKIADNDSGVESASSIEDKPDVEETKPEADKDSSNAKE